MLQVNLVITTLQCSVRKMDTNFKICKRLDLDVRLDESKGNMNLRNMHI